MKKLFFVAAVAVAALAVSCTKETENRTDVATLSLTASVNNAATKMVYTSDGQDNEGFTLQWEAADVIKLYTLSGSTGAFTKTASVTPLADAASAEIELAYPEAIAGVSGVKWGAYIDVASNGAVEKSKAKYATSYLAASLDLSSQAGTEADVHLYDVYYAGGSDFFADLASKEINFEPKTTVLKIVLTLPEDVTATTLTDIKIAGDGIYSKVGISMGAKNSSSTVGAIAVADQAITDHVATFYVALWAGSISNATLTAKADGKAYKANIRKAETALTAGTVYTLRRTAVANVLNATIYKTHKAETYSFGAGLTPSGEWPSNVTYDATTGEVSFAAETAAYNTNVLAFEDGSSLTVTRVDENDFAGDYTFYSKAFNVTTAMSQTITEVTHKNKTTGVTFTAVSTYGAKNGKTPNLEVTGLFYDFKLPACVEVDETTGPKFYFYLTNLEYQLCSNGVEMACIPEQTASATGYSAFSSNQNLAAPEFGASNCNYYWMPIIIDLTAGTLKPANATYPQITTSRYCYGFSFVEKGYASSSYIAIYQFNYGRVERTAYFQKN